MAGICNCRRPVIQNIVGNLWICTECATKVPDDEELEDPQTQNGNSRRIVGRSSLDLSWPKSVKYIDDDFPTRAVIEELKEIESILPSNKKQNLSFIRVKDERDGNNHSRTEAVRDEYYQYEPLNPAQSKDAKSDQWIRILRLSRGNEKDPLHCILLYVSLNRYPDYEAVSYTWADETGDSARRRPLYIGSLWQKLPISRNCEAALRRFRQCDREIDLWIDSICINQEDWNERRQQVDLMPMIYSTAKSVRVYLGAGSQDTSNAMFVLSLPDESIEPYLHIDKYIEALRALFHLPYFSRIWIIQELALAKEVRLYHGFDRQSVYLLHARDKVQQIFQIIAPKDPIPLWLQHYKKSSSSSRDIASLIFDGISSNTTLPEDKIFALFGMIYNTNTEGLVANYDLTVEQVYTGIAAYLVSRGHLLDVLLRSNRGNLAREIMDDPLDLPSWVPDFRQVTPSCDLRLFEPGYKPIRVSRCDSESGVKQSLVGVIRKTGSLVVRGYSMSFPLMGVQRCLRYLSETDFNMRKQEIFGTEEIMEKYIYEDEQIKINIEFQEPFNVLTDKIPLLNSEGNQPPTLHLRSCRRTATHDCQKVYTNVGLCSVSVKYDDGLHGKESMMLFLTGRPLWKNFVGLGSCGFNHFWNIYRFLVKNTKTTLVSNASYRSPFYPHINGNPWEYHQKLDEFLSTERYERYQREFQPFARFYDFWISGQNRRLIEKVAPIIDDWEYRSGFRRLLNKISSRIREQIGYSRVGRQILSLKQGRTDDARLYFFRNWEDAVTDEVKAAFRWFRLSRFDLADSLQWRDISRNTPIIEAEMETIAII